MHFIVHASDLAGSILMIMVLCAAGACAGPVRVRDRQEWRLQQDADPLWVPGGGAHHLAGARSLQCHVTLHAGRLLWPEGCCGLRDVKECPSLHYSLSLSEGLPQLLVCHPSCISCSLVREAILDHRCGRIVQVSSVLAVMQADKVKRPILLIHGEDDNNTGTFPMQVHFPSCFYDEFFACTCQLIAACWQPVMEMHMCQQQPASSPPSNVFCQQCTSSSAPMGAAAAESVPWQMQSIAADSADGKQQMLEIE